MDWVKQVQVICGSYCGANLLCGMCVKNKSVGFGLGFFFCTLLLHVSASFYSDDAVSSEGG